jgi:hypothetical protein
MNPVDMIYEVIVKFKALVISGKSSYDPLTIFNVPTNKLSFVKRENEMITFTNVNAYRGDLLQEVKESVFFSITKYVKRVK